MTDEAISPLRRRMIEDMTIRKLGPKTQQGYIRTIRNFAAFVGRSPHRTTAAHLPRFPPLEVFGRRPSESVALSAIGPASENLHRNGLMHCNKRGVLVGYSITSSAPASSVRGTVSPSARAVLRLMNS